MRRPQAFSLGLLLLASSLAALAEVSASRVRPVARKLEEHITFFAEKPEEEKELKALLPLKYSVVEDEEINAIAQRTRNTITVNRGILDLVESDDELAFVIGHEIGHILVGQMKKVELEKLLEQLPDEVKNEDMLDELLADIVGVTLVHKAGFDSDAAVRFFRRLIAQRSERDWVAIYVKGTSTVDDVHLIEEARLRIVSAVAEQLRDIEESQLERKEPAYIWVGRFTVSFESADGHRHEEETTDTLGIYTESDFRLFQEVEIEARKELVKKFVIRKLEGKIKGTVDVKLKGIERQAYQEQAERETWPKKDN